MPNLCRMTPRARLFLLALLACLALPASAMALSPPQHISFGPAGGNNGASIDQGFLSNDGSCVAFSTTEKLLDEDQDGGKMDWYERCGSTLTLVTYGPAAGAGTDSSNALFVGFGVQVSDDGTCVLVATNEVLTSDDNDTRIDLFKRCGDSTDRVTQGPNGGNAPQDVINGTLAGDGLCVVFLAHEQLTSDDADTIPDLFERCGTTTTRVSKGPAGGNDPAGYPNLSNVTPDGACVLFTTNEKLTDDDTDDTQDAYERCGSTTTKVSPGNDDNPVYPSGLSPDGDCVTFSTDSALLPSDTDSQDDTYRRCGEDLTQITAGNAEQSSSSPDETPDLRCFAITTEEKLTADDEDDTADVYKRCGSTLERVSRGDSGGNAQVDAEEQWISADGRCVVFSSAEKITSDDTDTAEDLFERCDGEGTDHVSQGPGGGNGTDVPLANGISSDGSRVVFSSDERLTADDTNDLTDVYERSNGRTTRVSPEKTAGDPYGSNVSAVSLDGTRVLYSRGDSLAASDTDDDLDLYLATMAPIASVRDATAITHQAATLNGVASGDPAAKYHFEYGTTDAYGTSTPEQDVPAGASLHAVSTAIGGLAPDTTYHFRLVVTSASGSTASLDRTFKTAAAPVTPPDDNNDNNGNNGDHHGDGNTTPPPPPPPPPAADYAGIVIRGGTIKVRKGAATITISCPATAQGSCAGALALKAKLKGKLRRIGGKRVELAAGSSARVKVRLSRAALKQLAKTRKLKATVTAVTHDARGANATSTKKLKLKR